uniref:Uncharacterized protein n=1 Tax=Amphimedon queenslandica TaxID=400682 RepID=A0A1X7TDA3_AMPQE
MMANLFSEDQLRFLAEWLHPGAAIPPGDPGGVAPGRDRSRSPVRGAGGGARRSASADPNPESGRGRPITGVHCTGLLEDMGQALSKMLEAHHKALGKLLKHKPSTNASI